MAHKSLISIAAATLLAASFVGCSSDDSAAVAATPAASSTAAIQTAVQAVDGYIYNATAKAHYLAEDNASMKTIAMTGTPTTKDVVSGKVTVGSSTYSLPADTNASVKSRIKFFSFVTTPSSTVGTTFTPAAYIEADGVDGYDTNDTLLGTTTILAPGNSKIASPLTSMIVSGSTGIFGSTTGTPTSLVDLNATTFAQIESNATKIAANLGLGDIDLLTADPVALGASNPTFKLVTALLKGATLADITAILAATPATTLAETLTIISTLPNAAGAGLAGTLANSAANGGFTTADVAGLNIEKSVENGAITSLATPTVTGKFPVSAIKIDNVNTDTLTASGAKLDNTNLVSTITMANNMDKNISTTSFNLVVAIKGAKGFVSQSDSNTSGALVVSLPFDLNSTNGVLAANVPAGTLVPYEVKASDGSQIVTKKDVNASTMTLSGTTIVSGATNVLTVNVGTLLTNVLTNSAENNLTSPRATGLTATKVSDLQVYLVDANGKIIGTDTAGTNTTFLGKGTLNAIAGTIVATEAIKIFNLGDADLRGSNTAANAAPAVTTFAAVTNNGAVNHETAAAVISAYETATTLLGNKVIVNEGSGPVTSLYKLTVNDEGSETNTTGVLSGLPTWVTATKTTLVGSASDAALDFNVTIDGNATVTGHGTTMATVKLTDEFGKVNTTDSNVSFMFNHAPTAVAGTVDVNTSGAVAADANTSTTITLSDTDGITDLNASASTLDAVAITAIYNYAGTAGSITNISNTTAIDVNWSTTSDNNITNIIPSLSDAGKVSFDVNLTNTEAIASEGNVTVTYTVTDIYGATSTEENATINIVK